MAARIKVVRDPGPPPATNSFSKIFPYLCSCDSEARRQITPFNQQAPATDFLGTVSSLVTRYRRNTHIRSNRSLSARNTLPALITGTFSAKIDGVVR